MDDARRGAQMETQTAAPTVTWLGDDPMTRADEDNVAQTMSNALSNPNTFKDASCNRGRSFQAGLALAKQEPG